MESNLILIEKESEISGLLFLGYGATIYRVPLLNILVSGKNIPMAVLELVVCHGGPLSRWWDKEWNLFENLFYYYQEIG